MTMVGDIFFTDHAVERFIKRHVPDLSFGKAKALLIERGLNAVPLKQKTINGDHQWQIRDPDVILVIKYGWDRNVCVTVLPEPENFGEIGISEIEMEIVREHELPEIAQYKTVEDQLLQVLTPAQRFELEQQRISLETKISLTRYQLVQNFLISKKEAEEPKPPSVGSSCSRHRLTQALRSALTFVLKHQGDHEADHILAEIQRIDPNFLTPKFLENK